MQHRILLTTLVGALILIMGACGRQAAPPPVTPVDDDSDRIAAEEAARLEAEERRRAEEEARRRAEAEQLAREATARAREILEAMVHFEFDQYNIRPDAEDILMQKVGILQSNPNVRLRIEGHADERGSTEYNLALGERRANAVRDFLAGYGITAERLDIQSFGNERPLDARSNEEAWARNRRAEFHITAGGDPLVLTDSDR